MQTNQWPKTAPRVETVGGGGGGRGKIVSWETVAGLVDPFGCKVLVGTQTDPSLQNEKDNGWWPNYLVTGHLTGRGFPIPREEGLHIRGAGRWGSRRWRKGCLAESEVGRNRVCVLVRHRGMSVFRSRSRKLVGEMNWYPSTQKP